MLIFLSDHALTDLLYGTMKLYGVYGVKNLNSMCNFITVRLKKKIKAVKTFSFLSDTAGRSLLTALYLRS